MPSLILHATSTDIARAKQDLDNIAKEWKKKYNYKKVKQQFKDIFSKDIPTDQKERKIEQIVDKALKDFQNASEKIDEIINPEMSLSNMNAVSKLKEYVATNKNANIHHSLTELQILKNEYRSKIFNEKQEN
ncbi:MAG: hypothetical protein AAF335_02255 [Bacteroidota bacterium]